MATIRKKGDRYHVQVRRKGYPSITKTFQLFADAKEWATHQERLADRGELGPDQKVLDTITLADIATRYRNEVIPTKRHGETDTFAIELILRHKISRKKLSALTPADFSAYRDERLKTVSPSTLRRQMTPLKHMFRHARDEWDIPLRDSPLSKLKLTGTDNRRERRLREGELNRLLVAGKKNRNPVIIPIVRFALETAMRRGEILALRFRDIDLHRGLATIRESKNGHSRTIPLTPTAIVILRAAIGRMKVEDRDKNGTLFPVTPLALRLSWDRLTRRAKVDDLHFHDLRHEAISRLFELGLTVPEVASISGHRDMRMLFRYAHATHAAIRAKLSPQGPQKPTPPTPRKVLETANDNSVSPELEKTS